MSQVMVFTETAVQATATTKFAFQAPFTMKLDKVTLVNHTAGTGSASTYTLKVATHSVLDATLTVADGAVVPTTAAVLKKNATITGAVAGTVTGTATYTVATGHIFKVGDQVTVASVAVSAGSAVPYNFTGKQVSAVTATTVTVTGIVGTPGTYASGGTIVCTTSPVVVPAGAVVHFAAASVSSTAPKGLTLAIQYSEAADTSVTPGGLDAARF
jgi:hypothetical protein